MNIKNNWATRCGYILEIPWYKHIYYSLKIPATIDYGFVSKSTWPGNHNIGFYTVYYDGWHWTFHILNFYISASGYD